MNTERIDFISSYCDRWCERCAFTSRCSAFAVSAAIAMCGDVRQGFELALGTPQSVEPGTASAIPDDWLADAELAETPDERAAFDRQEKEREIRIRDTSTMRVAYTAAMHSYQWLKTQYENLHACADDVLKEALDIASHDSFFVTAKLYRALHGRDSYEDERTDEPVQNDWNGSAKIALISLQRSEPAWRLIAQATGENTPAMLADQLRDLRREVEAAFPNAWSFIRPGFDEPGR